MTVDRGRSYDRYRSRPGTRRAVNIRETRNTDDPDWLALRTEFVPELSVDENRTFLEAFARDSRDFIVFIAANGGAGAVGFAEVSIRSDYVNGCQHRPALFLEGIYVQPAFRGCGIARALCTAAARWGLDQGCREFASDVYIDDVDSLAAHRALGFEETERVVYFRKRLNPD